MGNTSVQDVGSLFGNLNVGTQSLIANRISSTASTVKQSGSANFQSYLDSGNRNRKAETGNDVSEKTGKENIAGKPVNDRKDTSDRIAGEDKADAGKTEAVDKKQAGNKTEGSQSAAGNGKTRGTGLDEKSGRMTDEDIADTLEVMGAVAADFLVTISEILGIDTEDAEGLLDEMGLTGMDLLEPENLSAFALRAMGAEDSLSLLTNETHFEQFQSVSDALKQLLAEDPETAIAGMSDDTRIEGLQEKLSSILSGPETDEGKLSVAQLRDLIKDLRESGRIPETGGPKAEMPSDAADQSMDENALRIADTEKAPGIVSENMVRNYAGRHAAEASKEDGNKTDIPKTSGQAEGSLLKTMTTADGSTLGAQSYLKNSARGQEDQGRGGRNHSGQENSAAAFQNPVANLFDQNISQIQNISNGPAPAASAQDIANQIMDYMRSQIKPDMQTLEMQLHPASLGNIQISLVHKDGNLTASFACQDEQVRAVLENQMIQLQERFEEQGIKVGSIEVSVGAHGFEQNLEQQGHQEEDRAANAPKRVRRLQLGPDLTEEDISLLDEGDRIAAEMMAANGGTMDVQA